MRQLWINNKRMDSIAQLQQEFAGADRISIDRMCAQMLRQCQTEGSLLDWLKCRPERALSRDTSMPVGKATIESLIKSLQEEAGTPDAALLSELCGIEAQHFHKIALPSDGRTEKLALLEQQSWWPQTKELLQSVQDWTRVVVNNRQLEEILLQRSASSEAENLPMQVLYLCNGGGSYFFNPLAFGRSVKFIGCGNPVVRLDPSHKYSDIDMIALNLQFEDLTLRNSYGLKWKGWDEQTQNCTLLERGGMNRAE